MDYLNLNIGSNIPEEFNVVVEIPKDSTHKYELDKELGVFVLDRPLHTSVHYPGDYGFIPQTLAEDGDPLDVLVKIDKPTFSGCVIRCRPIGILPMVDDGEADNKILAVPINDPRTTDTRDIADLSEHFMKEIDHFFRVYKELENKTTETDQWLDRIEAYKIIADCHERWRLSHGT